MARTNLLNFDRPSLEAFFAARGEKPFRASQLLKWIHQQGVTDFDAMSNLSKDLRHSLSQSSQIVLPEIAFQQHSADGTRKWLLRLEDGNCIETVFIPEEDRGTLCISSQVGCSLNCSFCSTARQGFNRNLSSAEIISQLWVANRELNAFTQERRIISNVVMMGMGEPLLNFEPVTRALSVMLEDHAYGLSRRRVTLSTAGMVPAMDRLRTVCNVSLAVSLHAPNDALRDRLVPLNRKYPLAELMAACHRYVAGQGRCKITFEYVMLAGINDSRGHARELLALLRDVPAKVNLIPFNRFPGVAYQTSRRVDIDAFREILLAGGLMTVTRKTRGDDIDAACGQLVGRVHDRTSRSLRYAATSDHHRQEAG